jgi:hypothetical protein
VRVGTGDALCVAESVSPPSQGQWEKEEWFNEFDSMLHKPGRAGTCSLIWRSFIF